MPPVNVHTYSFKAGSNTLTLPKGICLVLGFVDDVILLPLGIMLVIRLIPPEIMAEHRTLATAAQNRPISGTAAIVIAGIWVASIALSAWLSYRYFFG